MSHLVSCDRCGRTSTPLHPVAFVEVGTDHWIWHALYACFGNKWKDVPLNDVCDQCVVELQSAVRQWARRLK